MHTAHQPRIHLRNILIGLLCGVVGVVLMFSSLGGVFLLKKLLHLSGSQLEGLGFVSYFSLIGIFLGAIILVFAHALVMFGQRAMASIRLAWVGPSQELPPGRIPSAPHEASGGSSNSVGQQGGRRTHQLGTRLGEIWEVAHWKQGLWHHVPWFLLGFVWLVMTVLVLDVLQRWWHLDIWLYNAPVVVSVACLGAGLTLLVKQSPPLISTTKSILFVLVHSLELVLGMAVVGIMLALAGPVDSGVLIFGGLYVMTIEIAFRFGMFFYGVLACYAWWMSRPT